MSGTDASATNGIRSSFIYCLLVFTAVFWGQQFTEIDALDWEVHNGGILLQREYVLDEAFHIEREIDRKSLDFEPPHDRLPVCFIFLPVDAVEFVQETDQRHLGYNALFVLVQIQWCRGQVAGQIEEVGVRLVHLHVRA